MNPDGFDDTDAGLITLQAIFSDWKFANIVDNLVFTLQYSLESFLNQVDNFWAVKPMLTLIKDFMLPERLIVIWCGGMEGQQIS